MLGKQLRSKLSGESKGAMREKKTWHFNDRNALRLNKTARGARAANKPRLNGSSQLLIRQPDCTQIACNCTKQF